MANISSWTELNNIRSGLAGDYVLTRDLLTTDADYAAIAGPGADGLRGWNPIGISSSPFTGTFDGGGYSIHGLTVARPTIQYVGLFGYINGAAATVSNLNLVDVSLKGYNYCGGLAGYIYAAVGVSDCSVSGSVSGRAYTGGLAGFVNSGVGSISGCTSSAAVSGTSLRVGGLIGQCAAPSISDCAATGDVKGTTEVGGLMGSFSTSVAAGVDSCYATGNVQATGQYSGGLMGSLFGPAAVSNCYARGAVTSRSSYVGGLVGYVWTATVTVDKCYSSGAVSSVYAYVGGLIGRLATGASVTNSFWDTESSGKATSAAGTGKTTAQMMTLATFTGAGWDMAASASYSSEDWFIDAGVNYPYLAQEYVVIPSSNNLKYWDGSAWAVPKALKVYLPPWSDAALICLRGVDEWKTVVGSAPAAGGVDDAYTKVLLHFEGTAGSNTFTDESGRTWSVDSGLPVIGSSGAKFGSGAFNPSAAGESISTPYDTGLDVGTGDVTVDFWVDGSVPAPTNTYYASFDLSNTAWTMFNHFYLRNVDGNLSGAVACYRAGAWAVFVSWGGLTLPSAVTHVAFVRSLGTWHLYFNGAEQGGKSLWGGNEGANLTFTADKARLVASCPVDELRYSVGIARVRGTFTVPNQAYGPGYNGMPSQVDINISQSGTGMITPKVTSPLQWQQGIGITFSFTPVMAGSIDDVSVDGVSHGPLTEITLTPTADTTLAVDFTGSVPSVGVSGAETFSGANGTYQFESQSNDGAGSYTTVLRKDTTWWLQRFHWDNGDGTFADGGGSVYEGGTVRYDSMGMPLIGADSLMDMQDMIDTASAAEV